QLVVLLSQLVLRRRIALRILAFGVGRREEADFAVENADQVVKLFGATAVTRGFQQLGVGAHVALDVRAGFGQQGLEDGPDCLLVIAVFGRGGGGTERFFEEGHGNALRATYFLQRGGRPRFALHHLGKQGQADADHLAFLGKSGNRLVEKVIVLLGQLV